jgi:hypothetical protein
MPTPDENTAKAVRDVPKPPGDIKPTLEAEPPQEPKAELTAAELRLEVDRLQAIIHHGIPAEYQYMVQGSDAETINHKASTLAELIARANRK